MSPWSYRIVAVVFLALAASFVLSTASVVREFWSTELVAILTAHSYLFVFFPTLGIVALAAFYVPAVIFTDLYLRHARYGVLRFCFGFVVAVLLSLYFASTLNTTTIRSIWEISPDALRQEVERLPRCSPADATCAKPILHVVADLREKSLGRVRMSPFIRDCTPDRLVEPSPEYTAKRYCFPTQTMLDAEQCCTAAKAFAGRVHALWVSPQSQSLAARLDLWLLPAKSFFVIIIMLIGVLLIFWKKTLQTHYGKWLRPMERGLQIGAVAMVFWPIMDYAYQQTSDILYSPGSKFPIRLSLVLVPWALVLTFHFYHKRIGIEPTRFLQIGGSVVSGIAVVRYDVISDWWAKLVGLGAPFHNLLLLAALSAVVLIMILRWLPGAFSGAEASDPEPDVPAPDTRPLS